MSIQDIRENPQDKSNFYLANIYQTLADPSLSIPAAPPPFTAPIYAVWANALWFLSLVISLTSALLATLLQQWARRYIKATQSRHAPHKRARIRAFLAEGVDKLLLPRTVEILPTLLHISLFLFFAGLVVFLWNVDLTNFKLVLSWVGICTTLYGCITVLPIFRHDSPYHTPLSLPAWHIVTGIQFLTFRALQRLTALTPWSYLSNKFYYYFHDLAGRYGKWLAQGLQTTVEETALNSPSEIDTRAFQWTFDCLDEDHELEHFFSGIPGFRSSYVVKDPFLTLAEEGKQRLFTAMTGLLDRTFSSDFLPDAVKKRRAIICTKAVDPSHTPEAFGVLNRILSKYQFSDPLVAEIVQIVRGWDIDDENAISDAKAIFSQIVARVRPHEDTWFMLASKALGVPEALLRDYAAHGDSLSFAILIHVTRQQFTHIEKPSWPHAEISNVLRGASQFNVQDTSPELQHKFCALWNHIVCKVHDDNDWIMTFYTLRPIRCVYNALHRDINSAPSDGDAILSQPSMYPLCNGHHPDLTNNVHDDSASTTFTSAVPLLPHDQDNTAPVLSFLSGSPHFHPLRVDESLTDAQPRNDDLSSSVPLQPIDQTATESPRAPTNSPNPVTTRATHGSIDTMQLSTPEPPASTPPPKSRAPDSPPDAIDVEHSADSCAPSLDVQSSPSPTRILPTGPPLTLYSPATGTDHASSSPESHSPMVAPGDPCPSPSWLFCGPDLGAASEVEGSVKPALREEKDALYPYLMIREGSMDPALPPQSPSPAPNIDVAIGGRSCRSLDAEHTGDLPPRPPCG